MTFDEVAMERHQDYHAYLFKGLLSGKTFQWPSRRLESVHEIEDRQMDVDDIRDDFYSQPLDCSSTGWVAVAEGTMVSHWRMEDKSKEVMLDLEDQSDEC